MKQGFYKVLSNKILAKNTYEMVLSGDVSAFNAPGQFINIKISGFFLRRPISICDLKPFKTNSAPHEGEITVIYKAVGNGTIALSRLSEGHILDVLTGLGNGFEITKAGSSPLLIGGGAGIPPMYLLAKTLLEQGVCPQIILGFNTADEIFYLNQFKALESQGAKVHVTTVDGSVGMKGFVSDCMKTLSYSYFFTCGPLPMLKAIENVATTSGQFSFEERMGCGFGACMGCTCKTKYGNKRICKDGPVLEREEIIW